MTWPSASFIQKKTAPTPPYKVIQNIADSFEPKLRKAIIESIAATKDAVVLVKVQRALESGDLAAAEAAIPWDTVSIDDLQTEVTRVLRDTMEQSGIASEDLLPSATALRFDIVNPRAIEWARNESATLVTQVSDETQLAIRNIITRAFEEGMHPYVSARLIRDQIGLTDRLAAAVDNYRKGQIAAGVKQEKVIARAARYARQLLNYRAKNIARTETLRASNMGQQELWRQARDAGLLDSSFKKVWLTTEDDRTCDICIEMDGQIVSLEGSFTGYRRNAQEQIAEIYTSLTPPIHPSCRCAIVADFGK
jgi:hypothetical protein